MTRRSVTTKYVIVHWKYLSTSHAAHATSSATVIQLDASRTNPLSRLKMKMTSNSNGMPVKMLLAKYHQCGRRSSATVSPSWIRFFGYAMAQSVRSRPAELVEPGVGHAEVVTDLVQHGHPHVRGEIGLVARERAQRAAADRDAIGRDAGVRQGSAMRQRHTLVEAEQGAAPAVELRGRRPLLDHHDHVVERVGEFGRDLVERILDPAVELRDVDEIHRVFLLCGDARLGMVPSPVRAG